MEISYEEYLKSIGEISNEIRRPKFDSEFVKRYFFLNSYGNDTSRDDSYYYVRLEDVRELCEIADNMRKNMGLEWLTEDGQYIDEDWSYSFYIEFHKNGEIKMSFISDGYGLDDDGSEYYFDLTQDEQDIIFEHLQPVIDQQLDIVLTRETGKITWRMNWL